nr:uncharacterized protein LOC113845451 [Anas platyrhynchos]XP_027326621.2 uncharacterized protein LOC113845451 [Anas platyrhynchos]XP_027326622.2 uncharacterized protein LOC113845451 [Anas platyrhynchos]
MLVLLEGDDSDNPLAQLQSASQGSAVPGWLPGCPRAHASRRDQARSRLPYRPPALARRPSPPWLLARLMQGLGSDGREAHIVAAHCGRAAGESKDFLAWSKSFPSPPCCRGWGWAAPAGLCAGNQRLPLHGGSRDGAGILLTLPCSAKIVSHQLCSTTCTKSLLQEEILGLGLVWGGLTALHRVKRLGNKKLGQKLGRVILAATSARCRLDLGPLGCGYCSLLRARSSPVCLPRLNIRSRTETQKMALQAPAGDTWLSSSHAQPPASLLKFHFSSQVRKRFLWTGARPGCCELPAPTLLQVPCTTHFCFRCK